MSYTALYRKFRPDSFADVRGQDHIVTTLKNQIRADRIGHAYLFCGTRGTGKTSVAKLFAKSVNCENPEDGSPCGACVSCRNISAGASMNVMEIDAASNNGVDNIREIVDEVSYSPVEGRYKVYIIDEVHMLSIGAFNALLKTLEEPPSYVIFILATTEVHKIPVTILSRCQRYDFKRISIDTISGRMRELMDTEGISVEEKALRYIAKTADGSLRDALSLLDQCIAFHYGQELTYDKALDVLGAVDTGVFSELLRYVLAEDVLGCIGLLEEIVIQGRELTQFVTDFTWYLRNLMLAKASDQSEDVMDLSSENLARLKEECDLIELQTIMRYIRIFSDLSGKIKYATQKRIITEMALIKLCKPGMETNQDSILDRIRELEGKLEGKLEKGTPPEVSGFRNPEQPAERKELPKAIPEEVQRAVEGWQNIIGRLPVPMKLYLKKAGLSLSGDNKLMIVLEDGLSSDYFLKQPDNRALLEKEISDYLQKEVSVSIQAIRHDMHTEESFVDLKQLINMDIEEEEEEPGN